MNESPYLAANDRALGKEGGVRTPTRSCEKLLLYLFRLGFHGIMRLGTPLFPFTGQSASGVSTEVRASIYKSPAGRDLYIFAIYSCVPGTCIPFKMKAQCFF